MQPSSLNLLLGLLTGLFLFAGFPEVRAEEKPKSDRVRFETVDQVELQGTFWPGSNPGRKAPCVMLLHRIGGKSHEDGWDQLAEALAKEGFAVLSFDFRGHGNSTAVGPDFFANAYRHNQVGLRTFRPGARPPAAISVTDFNSTYTPYLVNDIAAAKQFLERKNDRNECNSSNLIVIGAEEGATLGALWMASECNRYRILDRFGKKAPKPESKDLVAGIWLNISSTLGRQNVYRPLRSWIFEAGRENKIPMAFLYGGMDERSKQLADYLVKTIKANPRDEFPATGEKAIEKTKLAGSKLLAASLDTEKWILKDYLKAAVMPKFGGNEWEERESDKFPYIWEINRVPIIAKNINDKHLNPLPVISFMR